MKFASLIAMISAAAKQFTSSDYNYERNTSATPKDPTRVGRNGRMTTAQNRRGAKKARNVIRNRLAHR